MRASFPTTRSAKAGRHCGSVGVFRMCQGFPGGVFEGGPISRCVFPNLIHLQKAVKDDIG